MAGSKRNKLKKAFFPPTAPPPQMPADDEELMDDLMAQLDSRNQTVQSESANVLNEMQIDKQVNIAESSGQKQDPKSRYLARQARKAAALAEHFSPVDEEADARLKQETKDEEKSIKRTCDELGVRIHEINPDGHCLFSAIGDQLALLNIVPAAQANYLAVRYAASHYIYTHPNDFLPFLPSSDGGHGSGIMSPAEFEQYCVSIRDTGVWGGEPEILALSRAYNVPIHVIQGGSPPVVVHNPAGAPQEENLREKKVVRISYHRRMYGLGEHYNSLRPSNGFSQIADKLQQFIDPVR
jgi:OTU domain-containing protein 6